MRLFKDTKYDLSLEQSGSHRFMIWITACLFFIASLACVAALVSNTMLASWLSYTKTHITVEIPRGADAEGRIDTLANDLGALDGVADIQRLTPFDTADLVRPLLGSTALEMPTPSLLVLRLDNDDTALINDISRRVELAGLSASVQPHSDWARNIVQFGTGLYNAALLVFVIMASVMMLTLCWSLMSRITLHKDEVDILISVGADGPYISKQFTHFAVKSTIWGCGIGLALSIACLFLYWDMVAHYVPDMSFALTLLILLVPTLGCIGLAFAMSRLTTGHMLLQLGL